MSKKKRVLFIILWITLIVAIGTVSFMVSFRLVGGSTKKSLTDQDFKDLDYVNEKLEELRDSSDYAEMNKDEQMVFMLAEIKMLAKEGRLDARSIYADDENHYISYQYKCGVLGCEIIGSPVKGADN